MRARTPRLTVTQRKAQFVAWFKNRFFLRFHMTFILCLTFLAGLGVTKLLLVWGNTNLAVRYGIAVAASYAAFLVLLRAWLWYIEREGDAIDVVDVVDVVDLTADAAAEEIGGSAGFQGAAGSFGGGGSSGSFGEPQGDGASSLVPDVDGDFGVAVVVLVALVAAACVGGYLIYAGPTILAEAAFEALLASALIPGARRGEATGWMPAVVRATAVPFAGMLVVAVGFGWAANDLCPEARRIADVIACARR